MSRAFIDVMRSTNLNSQVEKQAENLIECYEHMKLERYAQRMISIDNSLKSHSDSMNYVISMHKNDIITAFSSRIDEICQKCDQFYSKKDDFLVPDAHEALIEPQKILTYT